MENIKKNVVEKIKEFNKIIIHRHVNPDPDALGSQGGLQEMIQRSFPSKEVYVVGEEVEGLKFLKRMDEVSDDTFEGALVIVCDTANTARISDERFNNGAYLIKIDHHPNREPYGDMQWVDTDFSSTSEMLVGLFIDNNDELKLSNEAAKLLYAGIIGDTGRFLYPNTNARTLSFASELLEYNFEAKSIFNELYKVNRSVAKLQGHVLQDFEVTPNGVAWIYLTQELVEKLGVDLAEAANVVNTMADVEGNNVWVLFLERDGETRVRIRSKSTPIDKVANQFNGGGHPLASGATVEGREGAHKLLHKLDELMGSE